MNRQFFDPNNEDYLYQTVRDKIIRDKQVDIDVNSNFKNMMSKLMNQVYQSKQDKTIDELRFGSPKALKKKSREKKFGTPNTNPQKILLN